MKITVVGAGYVGLANALMLARQHTVRLLDIDSRRIAQIRRRQSPIADSEISQALGDKKLDWTATTEPELAYQAADYIIVAVPTDYDTKRNAFDTRAVETVVSQAVSYQPAAAIVIKSTVPVGFTVELQAKYPKTTLLFSPEFLREGRALYDNLHPSRIIVGGPKTAAQRFARILKAGALEKSVPIICTNTTEAEAIKLFANTYLAMRVAFFNELDTYAEIKNLRAADIVAGVSADPRIGDYYNNPSFGYGGYCLPKDSKQLRANYLDIPSELIHAVVTANETRMRHIADQIIKLDPAVVGVYRLAMKAGSDNFRESAIHQVIKHLKKAGQRLVVYEPLLKAGSTEFELVDDLEQFFEMSTLIIANRFASELEPVKDKVYTRDIFSRD